MPINGERRAPVNYVDGAPYDGTDDVPAEVNRPGILQVIGGVDASGNARAMQMAGADGSGGAIIFDDDIVSELQDIEADIEATNTALAAGIPVRPYSASAGNLIVLTSGVDGADFVAFGANVANKLIVVNMSGVTIEVQQGADGFGIPIPNLAAFSFEGITNTNQLSVRRFDQAGSTVAVHGRWESI